MIDISVIVPIYNSEKYLSACIESVLSQSFTNIEIILVDDGSKDTSLSICNEYSDKDARVIVVHQPNRGVSVARNMGILRAKGTYLCFVDSDDIIPPYSFEYLWNQVIQHPNVDVVCGKIQLENNILAPSNRICDYTEDKLYIRSKTLWELLNFSAYGRLVKRQLVMDKKIFFVQGISCGEDPLWVYLLHKQIESVAQSRHIVYKYRVSHDSVMHQSDKTKNYVSTLFCAQKATDVFDYDGMDIECKYILDLLSVDRLKKVWDNCDRIFVKQQIKATYVNLRYKNIPKKLKFAAWRLTLSFRIVTNPFFVKLCSFVSKIF